MEKQFIPCPACGAVGEVGSNCHFCNTVIILKEGVTSLAERIPRERTVTYQQYAERICIFHKVEKVRSSLLMKVSIGDECGIINLNGEIVYPLQHKYELQVVGDTILHLLPKRRYETDIIYTTPEYECVFLGSLINLETLEVYNGIECRGNTFYAWEELRCKGEIDPNSWDLIGPPDSDRIKRAISYAEYEKLEEEWEKMERATEEQYESEESSSDEWLKWIGWAIVFLIFCYFCS